MTATAFDWFSPVHTARRYASEATGAEGDLRDPYERDRARIIHSGAFWRLQGKNQIFTASWSDYLRARVTHAMGGGGPDRPRDCQHPQPARKPRRGRRAHPRPRPPAVRSQRQGRAQRLYGPHADELGGGFEGNAQTYRILTRLEPPATLA